MGIVWGPRGPMSLGVPENPTDSVNHAVDLNSLNFWTVLWDALLSSGEQ